MAYLANSHSTREILDKYGFTAQKKYGQNFLIDGNVLEKIISGAEIGKDDCVLEIGPGIGTMTQYLAETAGRVVAVEIDRHLLPVLEETLSSYDNVVIVNEDILKVDIGQIAREYHGGKPIKVVANLPYYITTPVILRLLECGAPIESITVMIQKEVASRMEAGPGSKDYGALSLAVQYYAEAKILTYVSANSFFPRPGVDSAVIKLTSHRKKPVEVPDEKFMFALIRASFNQRRKTLVNSLGNAAGLQISKEQASAALLEMGLPVTVRGEALSLSEFAGLSERLLFTKKFTKSF
ncbi:MAG: 16S rRNA (adenine(1518)-N(6)/adenine(1519)-N(6))-dimethyltransferase RsmA [Lachnospiraceae bacterium]|nr:16S rRNA (adenine(1518)-N(6)/adenine(1519)-N(6))-dimethyltransferase RsmA [Lachnospiraceae bacterium]